MTWGILLHLCAILIFLVVVLFVLHAASVGVAVIVEVVLAGDPLLKVVLSSEKDLFDCVWNHVYNVFYLFLA